MGQRTWLHRLALLLAGLLCLFLIGQTLLSSGRWIYAPFPGFLIHENLTVGPYFVPGWSGAQAGLRPLDRIIAIDGRPVVSRATLYAEVRSMAAGKKFHYQVERAARAVDIAIPSMGFSPSDWFLSFGFYIVIGVAFLVIGVAPYFLRASSPAAWPLCFMVLTVFVWFQTTFDFMTDGWLPKELRIFALSLTPSAAIHLALILSRGESLAARSKLALAAIYAMGALLGGIHSATFFAPTEIWSYFYRADYIYVCLGAMAFLWITGRALGRAESSLERSRLRVMFVGALLGFLLPALTTVLISSFQLPLPYNLALLPTIVFPMSVAYALLKYSLFDLGQALRVALSRVALMSLLIGLYAALAFLIGPWANDYVKEPLVPVFFSILVVAVFNPLLRWLEAIIDRYIYRQDYDGNRLQEEISLFLRTLDGAPVLAQGFVERVIGAMALLNGIVVYRPTGSGETIAVGAGGRAMAIESFAADCEGLQKCWSSADPRGMAKSEALTNPRFADWRAPLEAVFARWRSEMIMPLVFEREVRGLVSFGAKRSGREYSAEDIRLLRILADQLALALENGRLYQESVQAYQRAEQANQKLIEMDRVKKEFVANICHELRTPVSTIIGYGEVLRDANFQGDARDILDRLVNNGQELSSLMDNLMNYSRMEADGAAAQREIVKLKELLSALEMMTRRLIRARPIEFNLHIEPAIDTIESDGQKLQQILVQLLTNALKFTAKGRVDLSLRRREDGGDEFLEIAVADTGIGIKAEDQQLIFDDFRQLDGSSTRLYGGTGLGLGLCKKLAAALGGKIQVSSEIGVGSVFSLLLPVKSDAAMAPR